MERCGGGRIEDFYCIFSESPHLGKLRLLDNVNRTFTGKNL